MRKCAYRLCLWLRKGSVNEATFHELAEVDGNLFPINILSSDFVWVSLEILRDIYELPVRNGVACYWRFEGRLVWIVPRVFICGEYIDSCSNGRCHCEEHHFA
jgi:hypothetical protein